MQRLGKNRGGYLGETIDLPTTLDDTLRTARRHGWSCEWFLLAGGLELAALHRLPRSGRAQGAAPRVYLSTGIHGDEPAGPLAVRQLLQEDQWPANLELWICPCLNPTGFALNRRENRHGVDLNRDYLHFKAEETRAHIAWLQRQPPFDVSLCLHEDWESHGFYVYELNPENRPSLAEAIVTAVAGVCPIDLSEVIEERPANNGIIRPSVDPRSRPQWPEAFYLLTHKTPLSYTLEAPSDFPLAVRVAALVAGVHAALELIAKE